MHTWVAYASRRSRASGPGLTLLLLLADRADEAGVCWPSVNTLAGQLKRSRRAVQVQLRKLVKAGELVIVTGGGRRSAERGVPSVYVLTGGRDPAECRRIGEATLATLRGGRKGAIHCAVETGKGAADNEPRAQCAERKGAIGAPPRAQPVAPKTTVEPTEKRQIETTVRVEEHSRDSERSWGRKNGRSVSLGGAIESYAGTAVEGIGNSPNACMEIVLLMGDRDCDSSLRSVVSKLADVKVVRSLARRFDLEKDKIGNPGGWWRDQLRRAGVKGV